MGIQVQKSRKVCGTCKYWGGIVRELGNSYVEVQNGFYDKCPCLSRDSYNKNQNLHHQGSCPKWEAKY